MDKSPKKKGFISFSGGETSGRMVHWLLENKSDEYDFKIVFANTGRENDETLDFVKKFEDHHNLEVIWLEASFEHGANVRKGTKHKIVTYETATRNQDWKFRDDTPYEAMVREYGLANVSSKFSTRELKLRPMDSYMRSIKWKKKSYDTFVGIRVDEIDRIAENAKANRIIYPLIEWIPLTKVHVNFWWNLQPFRLNLKGWEGNCVTCYKKSVKKLAKIMQDDPWKFEFDEYLEEKYGHYIPERRLAYLKKHNKPLPDFPIRIFRNNRSVQDIRELAKENIDLIDDSEAIEESCEVYGGCGDVGQTELEFDY